MNGLLAGELVEDLSRPPHSHSEWSFPGDLPADGSNRPMEVLANLLPTRTGMDVGAVAEVRMGGDSHNAD